MTNTHIANSTIHLSDYSRGRIPYGVDESMIPKAPVFCIEDCDFYFVGFLETIKEIDGDRYFLDIGNIHFEDSISHKYGMPIDQKKYPINNPTKAIRPWWEPNSHHLDNAYLRVRDSLGQKCVGSSVVDSVTGITVISSDTLYSRKFAMTDLHDWFGVKLVNDLSNKFLKKEMRSALKTLLALQRGDVFTYHLSSYCKSSNPNPIKPSHTSSCRFGVEGIDLAIKRMATELKIFKQETMEQLEEEGINNVSIF